MFTHSNPVLSIQDSVQCECYYASRQACTQVASCIHNTFHFSKDIYVAVFANGRHHMHAYVVTGLRLHDLSLFYVPLAAW